VEDLGVGGKVRTGFIWLEIGSSEQGNEPFEFHIRWGFLD